MYGTVGESGRVGVFAVVGKVVDVDAINTITYIIAYTEMVGHICVIHGISAGVYLPDHEVATGAPPYQVNIEQVGVDGECELVLSLVSLEDVVGIEVDGEAIEQPAPSQVRSHAVGEFGAHLQFKDVVIHRHILCRGGVLQLQCPIIERRGGVSWVVG